ncbi:MAG: hypothetical protein INR71_13935 [Terriglobus roseus]|nr:hypothetical protein [Terriglobus roseus]
MHRGIFHTVFNLLALVPLLERFEAENGTLVSLLLFFGRTSRHPAQLITRAPLIRVSLSP